MGVISLEQFKDMMYQEVTIPGFYDNQESITVKVKPVSLMTLASKGKIPNSLMTAVGELFGIGGSKGGKTGSVFADHLPDVSSLMHLFAEATLVEPKYSDIKDYLTDRQLEALFARSQGDVKDLTPIDEE